MAAGILDRPERATAGIRPEPAEFSWKQLLQWYQANHGRVWRVAHVTVTDIDETDSSTTVGISDLDRGERAVRAVAKAEGVPTAALNVIEREAVKPL